MLGPSRWTSSTRSLHVTLAMLPVREFSEGAFVVMATRAGLIKKTSLDLFANIRSSGIIALSNASRAGTARPTPGTPSISCSACSRY